MSLVARRYAQALLMVALEKNKVEAIREELNNLRDNVVIIPNIKDYFDSPRIDKSEKKQLLKTVMQNADEDLKNFILLLIDKNRLGSFVEITDAYHDEANNALNIVEGKVFSRQILTSEQHQRIEQALSTKLQKQVFLHNQVDEAVIGGVRIEINDLLIDGTLRKEIDNFKNYLLKEGKAHG